MTMGRHRADSASGRPQAQTTRDQQTQQQRTRLEQSAKDRAAQQKYLSISRQINEEEPRGAAAAPQPLPQFGLFVTWRRRFSPAALRWAPPRARAAPLQQRAPSVQRDAEQEEYPALVAASCTPPASRRPSQPMPRAGGGAQRLQHVPLGRGSPPGVGQLAVRGSRGAWLYVTFRAAVQQRAAARRAAAETVAASALAAPPPPPPAAAAAPGAQPIAACGGAAAGRAVDPGLLAALRKVLLTAVLCCVGLNGSSDGGAPASAAPAGGFKAPRASKPAFSGGCGNRGSGGEDREAETDGARAAKPGASGEKGGRKTGRAKAAARAAGRAGWGAARAQAPPGGLPRVSPLAAVLLALVLLVAGGQCCIARNTPASIRAVDAAAPAGTAPPGDTFRAVAALSAVFMFNTLLPSAVSAVLALLRVRGAKERMAMGARAALAAAYSPYVETVVGRAIPLEATCFMGALCVALLLPRRLKARVAAYTFQALLLMCFAAFLSTRNGVSVPAEFTLFFSVCAGFDVPRLLRGAAAALASSCALLVAACRPARFREAPAPTADAPTAAAARDGGGGRAAARPAAAAAPTASPGEAAAADAPERGAAAAGASGINDTGAPAAAAAAAAPPPPPPPLAPPAAAPPAAAPPAAAPAAVAATPATGSGGGGGGSGSRGPQGPAAPPASAAPTPARAGRQTIARGTSRGLNWIVVALVAACMALLPYVLPPNCTAFSSLLLRAAWAAAAGMWQTDRTPIYVAAVVLYACLGAAWNQYPAVSTPPADPRSTLDVAREAPGSGARARRPPRRRRVHAARGAAAAGPEGASGAAPAPASTADAPISAAARDGGAGAAAAEAVAAAAPAAGAPPGATGRDGCGGGGSARSFPPGTLAKATKGIASWLSAAAPAPTADAPTAAAARDGGGGRAAARPAAAAAPTASPGEAAAADASERGAAAAAAKAGASGVEDTGAHAAAAAEAAPPPPPQPLAHHAAAPPAAAAATPATGRGGGGGGGSGRGGGGGSRGPQGPAAPPASAAPTPARAGRQTIARGTSRGLNWIVVALVAACLVCSASATPPLWSLADTAAAAVCPGNVIVNAAVAAGLAAAAAPPAAGLGNAPVPSGIVDPIKVPPGGGVIPEALDGQCGFFSVGADALATADRRTAVVRCVTDALARSNNLESPSNRGKLNRCGANSFIAETMAFDDCVRNGGSDNAAAGARFLAFLDHTIELVTAHCSTDNAHASCVDRLCARLFPPESTMEGHSHGNGSFEDYDGQAKSRQLITIRFSESATSPYVVGKGGSGGAVCFALQPFTITVHSGIAQGIYLVKAGRVSLIKSDFRWWHAVGWLVDTAEGVADLDDAWHRELTKRVDACEDEARAKRWLDLTADTFFDERSCERLSTMSYKRWIQARTLLRQRYAVLIGTLCGVAVMNEAEVISKRQDIDELGLPPGAPLPGEWQAQLQRAVDAAKARKGAERARLGWEAPPPQAELGRYGAQHLITSSSADVDRALACVKRHGADEHGHTGAYYHEVLGGVMRSEVFAAAKRTWAAQPTQCLKAAHEIAGGLARELKGDGVGVPPEVAALLVYGAVARGVTSMGLEGYYEDGRAVMPVKMGMALQEKVADGTAAVRTAIKGRKAGDAYGPEQQREDAVDAANTLVEVTLQDGTTAMVPAYKAGGMALQEKVADGTAAVRTAIKGRKAGDAYGPEQQREDAVDAGMAFKKKRAADGTATVKKAIKGRKAGDAYGPEQQREDAVDAGIAFKEKVADGTAAVRTAIKGRKVGDAYGPEQKRQDAVDAAKRRWHEITSSDSGEEDTCDCGTSDTEEEDRKLGPRNSTVSRVPTRDWHDLPPGVVGTFLPVEQLRPPPKGVSLGFPHGIVEKLFPSAAQWPMDLALQFVVDGEARDTPVNISIRRLPNSVYGKGQAHYYVRNAALLELARSYGARTVGYCLAGRTVLEWHLVKELRVAGARARPIAGLAPPRHALHSDGGGRPHGADGPHDIAGPLA
ncbi:MAG: hypothetical protein J3K34DRAFT_461681, partial [Monoraphidium minutum]